MYVIQVWTGAAWVKCGSSNIESTARLMLADTANETAGAYRLVNPAGKVIAQLTTKKAEILAS